MIDIHQIMIISLFPIPFDHFHFHGSGTVSVEYVGMMSSNGPIAVKREVCGKYWTALDSFPPILSLLKTHFSHDYQPGDYDKTTLVSNLLCLCSSIHLGLA